MFFLPKPLFSVVYDEVHRVVVLLREAVVVLLCKCDLKVRLHHLGAWRVPLDLTETAQIIRLNHTFAEDQR